MKLLVLEDDQFICEQIQTYFELNDHKVDIFNDGETLLENAILDSYDLFLLDINTPKKNGIDTLKMIRSEGINTPAIFLTAMSDIDFVKKGYEAGCNDYVRKPFNLDEVELRITQLLHKNNKIIKIDKNYRFNTTKMELFYNDTIVNLSLTQKDFIYLLIKNIGSIVPPDIIIDYIWDEKYICDNTLRTHIKKLRAKLKNNFIINVRNSGYKIEKYIDD
ncbi:MAG: response regulator transcription factor [Campylobacterota bacterium]|nr:response regulator transcription factor [Campylobacterota bacterium]